MNILGITSHELGPEHAGFRGGIAALAGVVGTTTLVFAYLFVQNEKSHTHLQDQLDDLLGLVEDHEMELGTQATRAGANKIFDKWRIPKMQRQLKAG